MQCTGIKNIRYIGSAGYYFQCSYDEELPFYKIFRGENSVEWLTTELREIAKFVNSKIFDMQPMEEFEQPPPQSDTYHICEEKFNETGVIVMDHNHFTKIFRRYCHNSCNLYYGKSFVVPVLFHNLSHFLMKEIAKLGQVQSQIRIY